MRLADDCELAFAYLFYFEPTTVLSATHGQAVDEVAIRHCNCHHVVERHWLFAEKDSRAPAVPPKDLDPSSV
jgi:hypothetical protein